MKLDSQRAEAFLADPGEARVVLLHGEDFGLARDRAHRLTVAVAGSSDDPFAVVDLDRGSIDTVAAELSSLSMSGRRRVVRLRECGDFAVDPIRRALAEGGRGLIIAEAGVLTARSKLRQFVENLPEGMAISCFPPDSREKAKMLVGKLAAFQVTVDEDALAWIAARAIDQATAEHEADKFVSFAGPAGHLTFEDVAACSGEASEASLDDALFAAGAGLTESCDRALASAIADGVSAIQVLRATLLHFRRLSQIRNAMRGGIAFRDAARSARPSVPFRHTADLQRSLKIWTDELTTIVSAQLLRAERACKRTGAPAEMIARDSLTRIARQARARLTSVGNQ